MNTDFIILLATTAVILSVLFFLGFKYLPRAEWQFVAAVPKQFKGKGVFKGFNMTWYGFIIACSLIVSLFFFMVMTLSAGIPLLSAYLIVALLIIIGAAAAKLLARIIERRSGTITIGGAAVTGIVALPFIIYAARFITPDIPEDAEIAILAAAGSAYVIGESIGRLSCISFGCCYGKPLRDCGSLTRRLFSRFHFRFYGCTKKITYEGKLEGKAVLPIQAITAIIYALIFFVSASFFFSGEYGYSLICSVPGAMLWRFLSEFLRADFRGYTKISVYQIMSIAGIFFSVILASTLPSFTHEPESFSIIFSHLNNASNLMLFQGMFLAIFLYTGKSSVTSSRIRFKVKKKVYSTKKSDIII